METQPKTIAIVAAEPSHAVAIDRLLRQLAASEGTLADLTYELPELTDALSKGLVHALIAVSGTDVLGCLTYTWDFALWSGGRVMRIDDLIVDENWRDHGVGTQLMAAAAERAVTVRATARWEAEVENTQAQQFYRRLGVDLKNKVVARWSIESMHKVLGETDRGRQR